MELEIKRDVKVPIYRQIIELIEKKILCGEFPPGSLLPPERKLADQLNVNRMTIARVYDEMVASGLIERKRGSGTRVSTNNWGTLTSGATNWKRYVEGGAFLPLYPLMKRIKRAAANNEDILDLSGEELPADSFPSHLLSTFFKDIQQEDIALNVENVHAQGQLKLREAIVDYMREFYNVDTTSSSIIVTTGIQQSLYLMITSLLSPGDAIAIESPSYFYSYPLFQSAGLRVFGLPVDKDGVNPEDIVSLHRKHRIKFVLLIPTFQNPTGTVLSEKRRKRIAEIASELNIPISEGDPYYPIYFQDNKPYNPIKKFDQNGNIIYVGALSKTASLQLGIGWIAGPHTVIEKITDARQQMDFGVSVFSQLIGRKFLESKDYYDHLFSLRQELKENRDEMVRCLNDILGDKVEFMVPKGGFYVWCKLHQQVDDERLVEEGIKNNVLFMPGSILGASEGFVRFNFAGIKKDQIEEAITRFSKCLESLE